jgi:hypothetical protein
MTRLRPSEPFDPAAPAFLCDPFATLARLRESTPVFWSQALSSWVVTSYDAVDRILGDSEYSADRLTPFYQKVDSAQRSQVSDVMHYLRHWLVFRDPPDHGRLRRLLSAGLTPRLAAGLETPVQGVVDLLLADVRPGDTIDLVSRLTGSLPAMVIMDLLGVPRERLAEVRHWSDELVNFVGSPRNVPDKYQRARSAVLAMADYFRGLLAQRRVAPTEDLLTALITATDDGAPLSDDEAVGSAMALLFAGNETTTNFIGTAMLALIDDPEAQGSLRRDPDLMRSAVEELLRYDGPILSMVRIVRDPHRLGECDFQVGERIFAMIGAANRDPAVFSQPDRLNLTRKPNRHLQFGRGIHFCLGAALARMEAGLAIAELLRRFPRIELARPREALGWLNALLMRGPMTLPLSLH